MLLSRFLRTENFFLTVNNTFIEFKQKLSITFTEDAADMITLNIKEWCLIFACINNVSVIPQIS